VRVVWLTCLLAGCEYVAPSNPIALDDAPADSTTACVSFSTLVDTCTLPPGTPLTLSGTLDFDTNTGDLFAGAQPVTVDTMILATVDGEITAILASAVVFAADAQLRAVGARPFAILANDSISLGSNTLIDVSIGGAGARTECPSPAARGTDRNGGAGGGGGGGFGAAGGTGGPGDDDSASPAPGGLGGAAVALPAGILGGCPGAAGGDDDNDNGGRGGVAGGAVYLAAGRRIDIAAGAGIDAAGEGGRGGDQSNLNSGDGGGGGGGSGGMIVLESARISMFGTLAANGGGGGEGSGNTADGNDGADGRFDSDRAAGGSGSSSTGADGGLGGAKFETTGGSIAAPLNGGGGGGGGAAGFIRLLAPTLEVTAVVSPSPS
jgi:hypothetical protein